MSTKRSVGMAFVVLVFMRMSASLVFSVVCPFVPIVVYVFVNCSCENCMPFWLKHPYTLEPKSPSVAYLTYVQYAI